MLERVYQNGISADREVKGQEGMDPEGIDLEGKTDIKDDGAHVVQ